MPVSQNLQFTATVAKDVEFPQPLGATLMRRLSQELSKIGWSSDGLENWRDCGWSAAYHREASDLEIVVSPLDEEQWMLQVRPSRIPGFISGLLGNKPSATAPDVYGLALAVHRALSTLHYVGSPRWCWDGFPDENASSTPPMD